MAVVVEASALCWGFFCVILDIVLMSNLHR
nr:MAG TPA: hypothetical protein [Caudoviricetes sp.]